MLGWRRVRFTLVVSALFGLMLSLASETSTLIVVARAMMVGLAAMLAFGLFEQWPRRLPRWLARSALQLIGIVAVVPLAALLAYWITTGGDPQFAAGREAGHGLRDADLHGRAVRTLDRGGRDAEAARCLCARSGAGVRARAQSNSSARRWTRGCGCCRRRWSHTSCSTRWPTCRRWWMPARRRRRECWKA